MENQIDSNYELAIIRQSLPDSIGEFQNIKIFEDFTDENKLLFSATMGGNCFHWKIDRFQPRKEIRNQIKLILANQQIFMEGGE